MSNKYDYLKKYVDQGKSHYDLLENVFWSLDNYNEIKEAEYRIGFLFPISLKEFWKEVGVGDLTTPNEIAAIVLKEENSRMLADVAEYMEPDEMPFFEIGDSSSFLYMKPESDAPNAVYDEAGDLIEEDFEKFIYRLYHESPTYYLK